MRSKAAASPCCARRMASASPNSRTSVGLVGATGPVGTHQLLSMPSLLHKVVYSRYLLLSIPVGWSWLLREVWGPADRSGTGAACAAVLRQAGSILAKTCAGRRFGFNDGFGASETTLCRNTGNSASGSTQKNDFNTMVVSRRLVRSEEHTSELQSPCNLVCRLLLEKKKKKKNKQQPTSLKNIK